ncbi:hypothetical protein [Streptomyces sp. SAS_272]|uniref:hypothetical protein n=1 Tax=Streptomyces sp. SAS_272 TaxID=3412747 RepID=UPI00403CCC89
MNFGQDHDGERHEPLSLSPDEKADGFAAVMRRLKGRTAHDQDELRAQADAAVLGHEAYALGHDYRRRGNYVAAKRWLRVAADRSVPGAEEALEEIDAVTPAAPTTSADPADLALGATIPSPSADNENFGMWATVLESLDVSACAQAQGREITEQARRTAEDMLAEARRAIRRERADSVRSLEKARRTAARLLCEAEQVQLDAWGIQEEARRQADALLEEARGQAQQIVDEARIQAAQSTAVTRQHNIGTHSEAPSRTTAGWDAASAACHLLYTSLETAYQVAETSCEGRRASEAPLWWRRPLPPAQTRDLHTEVVDIARAIYLGEPAVTWFQDSPRTPSSGDSAFPAHPVIGHGRVVQIPHEVAGRVHFMRLWEVNPVSAADGTSAAEWRAGTGFAIRVVNVTNSTYVNSSAQDALKAEEAGHAAGR